MELYYKVIQVEKTDGGQAVTYQKEYRSSEPLFSRRAAIVDAEKRRDAIEAGEGAVQPGDVAIVVNLCLSAVNGLVSELPIHFIYGNEDLSMLTHHSWPLEASLYYQYQHDTGGNITTYMDVLVLPDVMEQVIEDHF